MNPHISPIRQNPAAILAGTRRMPATTGGTPAPNQIRRKMSVGRIIALTWLIVAIGLTALLGPELGWRGWLWLGLHDLLCVIGAGHELWRKRVKVPQR